MSKSIEIEIESFPKDNRYWCIQWTGAIKLNPNIESEPTIEIALTPLKDKEDINKNLTLKEYFDYESSCIKEIGVGAIPFLIIGSIWEKGKCLKKYPKYSTDFFSVNINNEEDLINPSYCTIMNQKEISETKKVYHIPTAYFPLVYSKNESFKALRYTSHIELDAQSTKINKIIIPCYELFRFYYANSSDLAKIIINGKLDENASVICDPKWTYQDENKTGLVVLRKGIDDSDLFVVARLALSKVALTEARNIYSSIVANGKRYNFFIMDARFPFIGQSTLKVHGKKFKSGEEWNFYVYKIEDCTGLFPFNYLYYNRDCRKETVVVFDEERPMFFPGGNITKVEKGNKYVLTSKEEPNRNSDSIKYKLDSNRFKYLKNIEIEEFSIEKVRYQLDFLKVPSIENKGLVSTGDGDNTIGKEAMKLSIIQTEEELKKYTKNPGLKLSLEKFKQVLEDMKELNNEIDYMMHIEEISWNRGKLKNVLLAIIIINKMEFLLYEFEREKGEQFSSLILYKVGFGIFVESELISLFRTFSKNNGWIKENQCDKKYIRKRFNHTRPSTMGYASKFVNYIENQLK